LSASPLLSGASGRLWIAKDGRARLELQAEKGDTQVLYDGHTLSVYDASSNTLYELKPSADENEGPTAEGPTAKTKEGSEHQVPSVAKIEEGIAKLEHVDVSPATPANVAGQPAYTERITPKEGGSLIGGAELSWDAAHGVPLRAALYSSTSSNPVLELAASAISYGPVPDSVFDVNVPPSAKVEEITLPNPNDAKGHAHEDSTGSEHPNVTVHGKGITGIAVLESKAKPGEKAAQLPEGLPKVKIGSTTAGELQTPLGTLLGFERDGVRYLLAGALDPSAIEAVARGL
ncbi:MAG TPA: hypothetical protein VMB05_16665, partial [Solirubrobacteraceae bacterium]|nr:hypothetical protein [Solirubrobacteraceae bacterium]